MFIAAVLQIALAHSPSPDTLQIALSSTDGKATTVGTVEARQTAYGVLFTPKLQMLTPGIHGFHLHQNPSCESAVVDGKATPGGAAGPHFDPAKTAKHLGPYAQGHLGDLPAVYADKDGTAAAPVLAPRLKLSDLKGRSLMLHAGGDNHADHPEANGGGAARVACGVVR